jgi:hypothetical protein
MKITPAITSVLVSLLSLAEVRSHGTETRHCITNDGNLRIFIEHSHRALASPGSAGTMQIKNLDSGTTSTLSATGLINNQQSSEIYEDGNCVAAETIQDTICTNRNIPSNPYYGPDDWVYFDFPVTCNAPANYELVSGNTVVLQEGCGNLYPVTIQGTFIDQGPPSPQINGATCIDNTVVSASTDSCDDTGMLVNFSAGAVDDCDPGPTVTLTQQSGTVFPVGDTSVTLTATDNEGSSKKCTFTVSVSDKTCAPSAGPSSQPSTSPSKLPSALPSPSPSRTPSAGPSGQPSTSPSNLPSALPSLAPSDVPTLSTAPSVSNMPSTLPSCSPSDEPSESPSVSQLPSNVPSVSNAPTKAGKKRKDTKAPKTPKVPKTKKGKKISCEN